MSEKSLEWKVEEAARLWLLDVATHAIPVTFTVRHHESDLSDENLDGTAKISIVALPVLILKATRLKQFTPALNIFLFRLETHLWAAADDTTEAAWQTMAAAREQILLWDELAAALSAKLADFLVHGIQEFGPSQKKVEDRHWTNRLDILLWAQPKDDAS